MLDSSGPLPNSKMLIIQWSIVLTSDASGEITSLMTGLFPKEISSLSLSERQSKKEFLERKKIIKEDLEVSKNLVR